MRPDFPPPAVSDRTGLATIRRAGYTMAACLVAEIVLTFFFLMVGSTDKRAPSGFAPIATGLCLTLIHLIGIPVTNLSGNPARSIVPDVFVGGWALEQLWLFLVAPIAGAALAGIVYPMIAEEPEPAGGRLRAASAGDWSIWGAAIVCSAAPPFVPQ